MGDRILDEEGIEALCICASVTKATAMEFQAPLVPSLGQYHTLFYFHKDCPLHGIMRESKTHNEQPFRGPKHEH